MDLSTFVQFAVLLAVAVSLSGPARAEAPRREARRCELSVHHVGEYAAVPWQKPGTMITPGSREDRVRDLNLSVASVNLRDDLASEFLQRWRDAPQPGKVFLPRLYFWDGEDRFQGPMRDIEVYWRRLDRFLGAMNLADFQGIVLGGILPIPVQWLLVEIMGTPTWSEGVLLHAHEFDELLESLTRV